MKDQIKHQSLITCSPHFLLKLFFVVVAFATSSQGCVPLWQNSSAPIQNSSELSQSEEPPSTIATPMINLTVTQSQPSSPVSTITPQILIESDCNPSREKISEGIIYDYYWSSDTGRVYFTSDPSRLSWYAYDLATREVRDIRSSELDLVQKWVQAAYRKYEGVYYSPSGNYAIYMKPIVANTKIPFETPSVYEDVYLVSTDTTMHSSIGQLFGASDTVYWSEDETKAIITMQQEMIYGKVSSFHAYLVDIKAMTVTPELPRNFVDGVGESINILNVSPDGDWLYFVRRTTTSGFVQKQNISKGQSIELPFKSTYLWPQKDRIFYLPLRKNGESDKIMLYDSDGSLRTVQHLPFRYNRYHTKNLLLSPDGRFLLFIDENSEMDGISLLSLCQ